MPDVTDLVIGSTTVGANFNKFSKAQSDVGRELIISVTKSTGGNLTDEILRTVYAQLTLAGGDGSGADFDGPDAFTLSSVGTADGAEFISGTTTVVFLKAQGTGTPNTTAVDDATIAVVATFEPRK